MNNPIFYSWLEKIANTNNSQTEIQIELPKNFINSTAMTLDLLCDVRNGGKNIFGCKYDDGCRYLFSEMKE